MEAGESITETVEVECGADAIPILRVASFLPLSRHFPAIRSLPTLGILYFFHTSGVPVRHIKSDISGHDCAMAYW